MPETPSHNSSRQTTTKVVLITGCSSGFGLHMAARLSARGHTVVATMRNLQKSGALLEEVQKRGGKVDLIQLDVTDKLSIKKAIAEIGDKYGYIDVLINNAGFGLGGFFEDLSDEEIRDEFETNFFGVQNVTRAVLPFMRPRKTGKIINISSISGLYASPAFSAYNASKWALEAFSESLYYELKPFHIDVCLVEPGTYKTKIFYENARYASNFGNPDSPYYPYSQHLKEKVKAHVDDCHKNPEDIAALVEKLMESPRPAFRNIPDLESQFLLFCRRFLPFRIYGSILYRTILGGVKSLEDHNSD